MGPLRSLLLALIEDLSLYSRVIVRYGAKTSDSIVFRDAQLNGWDQGGALDVMITVDEDSPDWDGHVGVITTIMTEDYLDCHAEDGIAVMCGPPLMMKFGTDTLLKRGYQPRNIYLSLERNMSCGIGQCGACTVHIDGRAQRSCMMPVSTIADRDVTTIEGLAPSEDKLHAVQKAWLEFDVPQCGYCQAGQIMATVDLLERNPDPSDDDIDASMTNICRCGTYARIRKAIHRAAELSAEGGDDVS